MTKISPSQADLLKAIAATEAGCLQAPEGSKKAATDLIKRGMLISVPQDGAPSNLMITNAGRAAIGGGAPEKASSRARKEGPPPTVQETTSPTGSIASLLVLLRKPEGATIEAMMTATGWQAHSVRGVLSGSIKKKLGLQVTSEKTDAGRVYRIAPEA